MGGMAESDKERWAAIWDFNSALMAGVGLTHGGTPKERVAIRLPERSELERSGLANVFDHFQENRARLWQFSQLPLELFWHGTRVHYLNVEVCMQERGTHLVPALVAYSADKENPNDLELHSKLIHALTDWINGKRTVPGWGEIGGGNQLQIASIAALGRQSIDSNIKSFCTSLLIQAWTVFEALAEELWEAAINAHPSKLSRLAGKPRFKGGTKTNQPNSDESRKMVPISELEKYQFDVRNRMGTILLDVGKVSFRSLPDIRAAYHSAFWEHAGNIDEVLNDPGLQYAAAVRNVFIHKAGKVDQEFFDQTANVPGVPTLKSGDPFPLTGKLCAKLVDDLIGCSCSLIRAVHSWIIGHDGTSGDQ